MLLPWLAGCLVVAGLPLLQLVRRGDGTRVYLQPCRAPNSQGWISNDRYCYLIYSSKSTFGDSKRNCSTKDGDLVSIHSQEETTFLVEAISALGVIDSSFMQTGYWTGLQQDVGRETNRWSDRSNLDYQSWANGEPNSVDERCVELFSIGLWNDVPCDVTKGYICKKPDSTERVHMTGDKAKCKDGWTSAGRSCYLLSSDRRLVGEARSFCKSRDADLLSVPDNNDSLLATFAAAGVRDNSSYWIGLRACGDGNYEWLDGTSMDYSNWFAGQPNRNAKECVEMFVIGTWSMARCQDKKSFICKQDMAASVSTHWSNTWTSFTDGTSIYARPHPYTIDTFAGAASSCRQHGGRIVSIHSAREAQFFANMWRELRDAEPLRLSYWIGLRLQSDGSFGWSDGTPFDYHNWQVDPPKQANKNCVEMLSIGSWSCASCDEQKPFICKASEVQEPGSDALPIPWLYRPTTVLALYISGGLIIALLAISWIAYGLRRYQRKRGQPKLSSQEAETHHYETTLTLATPGHTARSRTLDDGHAYASIKHA